MKTTTNFGKRIRMAQELSARGKITTESYGEIRRMFREGKSTAEIAEIFSVTADVMRKTMSRKLKLNMSRGHLQGAYAARCVIKSATRREQGNL